LTDIIIAILKAVAEKLIPGIPIPTRISILQQTSDDGSIASDKSGSVPDGKSTGSQFSVLDEVLDRATSRSEIQHEIDGKY
jgi:hypothetical protein